MEFYDLISPKCPRNSDIIFGTPTHPVEKMKIMPSDDFEDMVLEWAFDYLKTKYHEVRRIGGSGDKGRDIIGYLDDSLQNCDIYQCKHYGGSLAPSQYWTELGKLCYYTHNGDYAIPKQYFIVASQGLGPAMRTLLDNPKTINGELIAKWDQYCKKKITDIMEITLTTSLRQYIENFDFSIVKDIPPLTLITQYAETKWFKYRFGGGLRRRPKADNPPSTMDAEEKTLPYVTQLLGVYSEYAQTPFTDVESVKSVESLFDHFERQRRDYHSAQSLKRFSREEFIDEDPYEEVKEEVFSAVVDVSKRKYDSNYDRVNETLNEARRISLDGNELGKINPSDKSGICHELVNDTKLKWVNIK